VLFSNLYNSSEVRKSTALVSDSPPDFGLYEQLARFYEYFSKMCIVTAMYYMKKAIHGNII
jgi:hypothetical protein